MPKLPPYAVLLRELPTHKTFDVSATEVGDWLRGMPMRDALGAPVDDPEAGKGHADLELYGEESHVFATGTFKGHLVVACSRCVEAMTIPIDEQLMVTFMPRHEMPIDEDAAPDDDKKGRRAKGDKAARTDKAAGATDAKPGKADKSDKADDDGVEVSAEDLDLFPYDGEHVDLEPLFREQFVLTVPYAPLCREDCKGLCPQCGINKNSATCTCEKPIDPRLAALKNLKLPS